MTSISHLGLSVMNVIPSRLRYPCSGTFLAALRKILESASFLDLDLFIFQFLLIALDIYIILTHAYITAERSF